jgi:hypothetical protein
MDRLLVPFLSTYGFYKSIMERLREFFHHIAGSNLSNQNKHIFSLLVSGDTGEDFKLIRN